MGSSSLRAAAGAAEAAEAARGTVGMVRATVAAAGARLQRQRKCGAPHLARSLGTAMGRRAQICSKRFRARKSRDTLHPGRRTRPNNLP